MQSTLLSFFLIILTGALFKRFWVGPEVADTLRRSINILVLNLFLPALCLRTIYLSQIDRTVFLIPAAAIATILTIGVLAWFLFTFMERQGWLCSPETGVLILSAAFGNVTYLGIPVLSATLGPEAIRFALYYDLLATTPLLWLVGAPLAARMGAQRKRLSLKESLRIIFTLPPLWGIFGGMVLQLANIPLPGVLLKTLEMLGSLVVPLMIFSIGLALSLSVVARAYLVIPVILLKLGLSPLVSWGWAQTLGLTGQAFKAVILEGAMPTMVLSLLVAAEFELAVSLSAFTILVTTLLSFLTLPLIYSWLS